MKHRLLNRFAFFCLALVGLLTPSVLSAQIVGNPTLQTPVKTNIKPVKTKVTSDLLELEQSYSSSARKSSARTSIPSNEQLLQVVDNKVVVDITVKGDATALKSILESKGMIIKGMFGRVISGLLPISAISEMQQISSVKFVMPAYKPWKNVGLATSQADSAMRSTIAKKNYGVDGLGVKIGVLSDSYNNLNGAAQGVLTGDLPGPGNPYNHTKPVQVLSDITSGGSDEGRAMIELIHDVAPGSELAFHTAFNGQADFAQGIIRLANSGCKVITDDVIYYAEPFFQDGIIAQAIDIVAAQGVSYFSAAGNQGRASYESDFRNTGESPMGSDLGEAHNFGAYTNPARYYQPIFIPKGGTYRCSFQWDDSFYSASGVGAESDMDIYLLNAQGTIIAGAASDNIASGNPVEVFSYFNNPLNTTTTETFYLYIVKYAGPDPNRLKYVNFGDGAFYLTTPEIPGILSSTLVGHANASGAVAVGASAYYNTPAFGVNPPYINSFSSLGGTPTFFDTDGNRIGYVVRNKPEITAVDGTNTTFFTEDIAQDSDTLPNFFGTSAAAPHAAAVAALMIEASRSPQGLTPEHIVGTMAYTAVDMDDPNSAGFSSGFDYRTGFGLLNAEAAVAAVGLKPNYVGSLGFTAVCSEAPDSTRRWRINNPNGFNVRVDWSVYQTNQKGSVIAPPGYSYFTTATVSGSNTTTISWKDGAGVVKFNSKASTSAACGAARESSEILANKADAFEILTAYPNPSDGKFNLLFLGSDQAKVSVKMYDVKGQQVYTHQYTPEVNNSLLPVDTSRLPNGLYLMQVVQGEKRQTLKIVKQ
ncbi:T9SS type A sorting domain-containing protein [Cytophagaceae bacterium DM2B3-1]|uniref:T9SS type A sorting domain-containing protein n=1 Tax=Xanthocytophaga flava TaxID=3048013 RepID=A0ABT7CFJ3_9BACT|nr:T9SS type A sorting domain-containing protein [Xanthocytophaga flavus]MDJ1492291.1 T9SS type A sorting domain-containing protein [Xanthocytophaga flavus]